MPTGLFTPGGLAVFLTDADDATIRVWIGDHPRPVHVTEDDLTCNCGSGYDVPSDAPAKWLAINKVLNDGRCADCPAE